MSRLRTWVVGVTITAALSYLAFQWWKRSSQPKPSKRRGTRKSRDTWVDVGVDKKKRKLSTDEGTVIEEETSSSPETQQTSIDGTSTQTSTTTDTSQVIPASSSHTDKSPIFYDLLKLYAGVDQQPSSRASTHAHTTSSPSLSSSSSYPRGTSLSESIVSMAPLAPSASRRAAIPVPVIPFASTSHLHPHAHSRGPSRAHASLSDGAISSSDDTQQQADGEESTGEESDITPLRSARLRRMRRTRVVSPRRSRGSIIPHTNSLVSSSTSSRTRKPSSSFPRSHPQNNNK